MVAGAAEDGATLPVGELVDVALYDVVQREAQEVGQDRGVPQDVTELGGHVVTIKSREVAVVVTHQLLDLLGDFACLTDQAEDQVHELVGRVLVPGSAQRCTLVVVAIHGVTVTPCSMLDGRAGPFRIVSGLMQLIDAASAEFERVVRRLPGDAWSRPTPAEVTVRELVEHVVVGNRFTALLLSGTTRDEARARLTGDQLGDDAVAAVAESAARQAEAFAAAPPDQVVPHPNGDLPASAFLRLRLVDLVVHAWDLLRAAGLDETLDPAVVEGLWAQVEPHLREMLAFGAYGDGPSGTVPPAATDQAWLLDAFGRRP